MKTISWLELLANAVPRLVEWKAGFGLYQPYTYDSEKATTILSQLTDRLKGNYPFFHPVYAGQMLKPPADIALAAYALATTINPNNHALDGGPPSSEMEKEVVKELATMLQFGEAPLGHLTSGGTVANLEALWVARNIHPEKAIGFSKAAHYTHSRMAGVLGLKTVEIPLDSTGKMDVEAFKRVSSEIGTLVVTMGTTGLGLVEPLNELVDYCRLAGVRIHVDAAYGGFYSLISKSGLIDSKPWEALKFADSLVIDPHKHGLQPYGCGCVLFRDASVGRFYKHDSPYTYFSSDELHLGEISLECSRAGAAAVAFWATTRLFPLSEQGLGNILKETRNAALLFNQLISTSRNYVSVHKPELDIVSYFPSFRKKNLTSTAISNWSTALFHQSMHHPEKPIFLSLYKMDSEQFSKSHPEVNMDSPQITVLRSVFMKPEQHVWMHELVSRLEFHAENIEIS